MKVLANVAVNMADDTITLQLEFIGHSEIEHEFVKQLCSGELVESSSPEDVKVEIPIKRVGALSRAKRALENKKRVAAGRPTVEAEEKAAKDRADEIAKADAVAKAEEAKKAADQAAALKGQPIQ